MATNNQNSDNRNPGPAALETAAPVSVKAQAASPSPPTAPAPKKPVSKPVADLAADFTNVRGQTPTATTPSLAQPLIFRKPDYDAEKAAKARLFKDISVIRLNHSDDEASGITAARNDLRDEAEGSYSYGYSEYSDYGDEYVADNVWEDQIYEANNQIDYLQDQAFECRIRRDEIQARMDARQPILDEGDAYEGQWIDEQNRLTDRVDQNKEDLSSAEAQQAAATEAYFAKVNEIYGPEGKPLFSGDGPDDVETNEEKLRQDAWAKNRDAIEADYVAKGLTKEEFAAMERSINGQESKPGDNVLAAADKARAAGISGNLYVALNEKLKETDPSNPYLNTKDSKSADSQKALETGLKASREFVTLQNEHVQEQIDTLQAKRDTLAKAREDNDADAKEKLKATTNLQRAEKDIQDLNTYKTWIAKNEGTQISRAEFEKNVPESMRESFARDMAAQNVQTVDPATPQGASRSIASAAASGIDAPSAKDSFNTAAPATPAATPEMTPEAAPAPAPEEPRQTAAAAPAAPAI